MATSVPAIRGKMGSIEFFEAKMRARELASSARAASELEDWEDLTVEERMQRELNKRRVREEIVPYLAKEADRFFGSILILVRSAETFAFEPIGDLSKNIPMAYKAVMSDIGVLTIDGGELVVLDGQHRLAALRAVVTGEDDRGRTVIGEQVSNVPNDEIVVVFVQIDTHTTRKIFSKINKHAKTTSTSDNIVISEDDGYAIVSRMLIGSDGPLNIKVGDGKTDAVTWRTQTLSSKDPELTTLAAVYATVKDMLAAHSIIFSEKQNVIRPPDEEIQTAADICMAWWQDLLEDFEPFRQLLSNREGVGHVRADNDFSLSLLTRPAGQIALVRGLVKAVDRGVDRSEALQRGRHIDWRVSAPIWRDVIVQPGGRIIARNEAYELASELIAYLVAGTAMDEEHIASVQEKIAAKKGLVSATNAADDLDESEIYSLPQYITSA